MEIVFSENMTKTADENILIFVPRFVLFFPQEQPGLHAHEAVTDKGEQVHPGPEQLPFR